MAIKKVFYTEEGDQLVTYINQHNKCYICIGADVLNFESIDSNAAICLESDDLLELINELVYIREQMNNE